MLSGFAKQVFYTINDLATARLLPHY